MSKAPKRPAKRGNGVAPETLRPDEVLGDFGAKMVRIRRKVDGRWSVEFDVELDLELPDGRRLHAKRRLAVSSIVQIGRKAR